MECSWCLDSKECSSCDGDVGPGIESECDKCGQLYVDKCDDCEGSGVCQYCKEEKGDEGLCSRAETDDQAVS